MNIEEKLKKITQETKNSKKVVDLLFHALKESSIKTLEDKKELATFLIIDAPDAFETLVMPAIPPEEDAFFGLMGKEIAKNTKKLNSLIIATTMDFCGPFDKEKIPSDNVVRFFKDMKKSKEVLLIAARDKDDRVRLFVKEFKKVNGKIEWKDDKELEEPNDVGWLKSTDRGSAITFGPIDIMWNAYKFGEVDKIFDK